MFSLFFSNLLFFSIQFVCTPYNPPPPTHVMSCRCCEDLTETAIVERRTRDNVSLVLLVLNKWYWVLPAGGIVKYYNIHDSRSRKDGGLRLGSVRLKWTLLTGRCCYVCFEFGVRASWFSRERVYVYVCVCVWWERERKGFRYKYLEGRLVCTFVLQFYPNWYTRGVLVIIHTTK